jgi:hypothetical protein
MGLSVAAIAKVTQWLECLLSKQEVASSNLVFRIVLLPWYKGITPSLYLGNVGSIPTGSFLQSWQIGDALGF